MIFTTTRFLSIVMILCATMRLSADVPNGQLNFTFNEDNAPVYDLTGSFQIEEPMIGAGGAEVILSYGVNLAQNSHGFIEGSGQTLVAIGNDFVAADYTARGKISRGNNGTRVTLSVRLSGQDVVGGTLTQFNINISYNLTVAPGTGTLQGTARGSARFGGLGNSRIRSDVSVAIPGGSDGAWTLQMNIVPLSKLGGSAVVILSNGRTLQFNLTGSYSAARDTSKIKMSGINDSRGNSLSVQLGAESRLRGKVFGQSVRCDGCF